jgi:hypothetical protein
LVLHSNRPPGSFAHGIVSDHVLIALDRPIEMCRASGIDQAQFAIEDRGLRWQITEAGKRSVYSAPWRE